MLDVSCGYNQKTVLSKASLRLSSNDFLGVIGPNGSGKTTLLRSLSKTLRPRTGTVLLDQTNLWSFSSSQIARTIGIVPQETESVFGITALDMVLMGRNPHQGLSWGYSPNDYNVAKKVMQLTKTLDFANREFADLSGGEKQRVIIAQALAQEPQILLLDEPTAHLDINHQLEILDIIRDLNSEKHLAILAVFHDLNLAAQYCKQLLVLKEGKIVTLEKTDQVLRPGLIKDVFGINVAVNTHPITQRIFITPLGDLARRSEHFATKGPRIHLICGAETGSSLMSALYKEGYNMTCGVLNVLDTDQKTAELLDIPHAAEAPFSNISDRTYDQAADYVDQADILIITDVPFGQANIRNLELAERAQSKGVSVVILDHNIAQDRDYTAGEALRKLDRLVHAGATLAGKSDDLIGLISQIKRGE
jgi:iron complex transport system ATP-binding protein